jgi:putative transposase
VLSEGTLDQLTAEFKSPQDLHSTYSQMLQHMINSALEGKIQTHLGHERNGRSSGNTRNGQGRKTVLSTEGALQIETPPRSRRDIRAAVSSKTASAACGDGGEDSGTV